jgi:hypothetical protein
MTGNHVGHRADSSSAAYRHSMARSQRLLPAVAYVAAQGLYLATLAPTVLWGDEAKFQRMAYARELNNNVFDHPIWVASAHLFAQLPVGDAAFRANLAASVWAALTVALLFALLLRLTHSPWAATTGAGTLLVSHTFWSYGVRAEVYTLNLALLMICLYALSSPAPGWGAMLIAGVAAGVAVDNHVMMWLAVPGLAALAIWSSVRARMLPRLTPMLVGFSVTAGLYLLLFPAESGRLDTVNWLRTWTIYPADLARSSAYLCLQFPGPALVLATLGLVRVRTHPEIVISTAIITALIGLVVITHRVPDQAVFWLPVYLMVALWVGLGAHAVLARWEASGGRLRERLTGLALTGTLVTIPVVTYASGVGLLPALGVDGNTLGIRDIPGRPALSYFLWPPKNGYLGARDFALAALNGLAPGATIIADYTVAEPMRYLQAVDGVRLDVHVAVVGAGQQVEYALAEARRTTVYLALTEPYYDIEGLRDHFDIIPTDGAFRLDPLPEGH